MPFSSPIKFPNKIANKVDDFFNSSSNRLSKTCIDNLLLSPPPSSPQPHFTSLCTNGENTTYADDRYAVSHNDGALSGGTIRKNKGKISNKQTFADSLKDDEGDEMIIIKEPSSNIYKEFDFEFDCASTCTLLLPSSVSNFDDNPLSINSSTGQHVELDVNVKSRNSSKSNSNSNNQKRRKRAKKKSIEYWELVTLASDRFDLNRLTERQQLAVLKKTSMISNSFVFERSAKDGVNICGAGFDNHYDSANNSNNKEILKSVSPFVLDKINNECASAVLSIGKNAKPRSDEKKKTRTRKTNDETKKLTIMTGGILENNSSSEIKEENSSIDLNAHLFDNANAGLIDKNNTHEQIISNHIDGHTIVSITDIKTKENCISPPTGDIELSTERKQDVDLILVNDLVQLGGKYSLQDCNVIAGELIGLKSLLSVNIYDKFCVEKINMLFHSLKRLCIYMKEEETEIADESNLSKKWKSLLKEHLFHCRQVTSIMQIIPAKH